MTPDRVVRLKRGARAARVLLDQPPGALVRVTTDAGTRDLVWLRSQWNSLHRGTYWLFRDPVSDARVPLYTEEIADVTLLGTTFPWPGRTFA